MRLHAQLACVVAALFCFDAAQSSAGVQLSGRLRPTEKEFVQTSPAARISVEQALLRTVSNAQARLHTYLYLLSLAAVVTTIALQLSPLPSALEIRRYGDVRRYDGYPYFAVLAGAAQWCVYGGFAVHTLKNHTFFTMVAANGPGVAFGLYYVSTYLRFVPAKDPRNSALKRYLMFLSAVLACEGCCCIVFGSAALFWLGLLGAVGSAQIALSPFKTLPEVLSTRSTRSWPFDLCVWNLIQSMATGSFGLANHDAWVWVPNAIGVVAAVIQLSLIAAFTAHPARGGMIFMKAQPLKTDGSVSSGV